MSNLMMLRGARWRPWLGGLAYRGRETTLTECPGVGLRCKRRVSTAKPCHPQRSNASSSGHRRTRRAQRRRSRRGGGSARRSIGERAPRFATTQATRGTVPCSAVSHRSYPARPPRVGAREVDVNWRCSAVTRSCTMTGDWGKACILDRVGLDDPVNGEAR